MFDTNVPVKVIFAGPALSGKTTFVTSLHHYAAKQQGLWGLIRKSKEPSVRPKKKSAQIAEDSRERTVGSELHLLKVNNDLYLNIQDLGGQESFYALHSIFIHHKESVFFVIFSLEKHEEQLKEDISNQVRIILSHCYSSAEKYIIFLGTHIDRVQNVPVKKEKIKHLLHQIGETFGISVSEKHFINAKNPSDDEMANILKSTREMASRVTTSLVSSQYSVITIPNCELNVTSTWLYTVTK